MNLKSFVDSVLKGVYGPLDSNGLPFVNYGGYIGEKCNPTTMASRARKKVFLKHMDKMNV